MLARCCSQRYSFFLFWEVRSRFRLPPCTLSIGIKIYIRPRFEVGMNNYSTSIVLGIYNQSRYRSYFFLSSEHEHSFCIPAPYTYLKNKHFIEGRLPLLNGLLLGLGRSNNCSKFLNLGCYFFSTHDILVYAYGPYFFYFVCR